MQCLFDYENHFSVHATLHMSIFCQVPDEFVAMTSSRVVVECLTVIAGSKRSGSISDGYNKHILLVTAWLKCSFVHLEK